jgi:hypothetical protein
VSRRTGRTWRPSLDDYDLVGSVDPDNYQQGSGRRVWPPHRSTAPTITSADVISAGGCWCGQPYGHDWPGKADGAPHPR